LFTAVRHIVTICFRDKCEVLWVKKHLGRLYCQIVENCGI